MGKGYKELGGTRGIGLMEMALFVVATGIVLASAAPVYHVYVTHKRLDTTNANLAQANQALNTYLRIHGTLPCPTSFTAPPDQVDPGNTAIKFGTAVSDC